jgi:hypothetical protein
MIKYYEMPSSNMWVLCSHIVLCQLPLSRLNGVTMPRLLWSLVLLATAVYHGVSGTSLSMMLRRGSNGRLGIPAMPREDPLPPDEWCTQPLDHFDPTNNNTWQQVRIQQCSH